MTTYTVSTVSKMLGVNEETIRRWIRDGKLNAKRAVGRGGNSILLEDVIAFANKPPRAYLLSLEDWLSSNGISYRKKEDSLDSYDIYDEVKMVSGAAKTILTSSLISPTIATPAALGVLGAYGATKIFNKKNYRSYTIQLINSKEENKGEQNTTSVDVAENRNASFTNSNPPLIETPVVINDITAVEPMQITDKTDPLPLFSANVTNILDDIARAKQMLDAEIITQEDFNIIKTKLISML